MKRQLLTIIIILLFIGKVKAQINPCDSIINFNCSDTVYFNSIGNGDSVFIYKFTAPYNGTFQLNVIDGNGGQVWVEYLWKYDSLGCSPMGWNNWAYSITDDTSPIGAVNLDSGQAILIKVAALVGWGGQIFQMTCGIQVCDSIPTIHCGDSISFQSNGYGNPDYPYDIPGSCSGFGGQGGEERIYRLHILQPNYYYVNAYNTAGGQGNYVDYLWKYDSLGCDSSNWNCFGLFEDPGWSGAIYLLAGNYLILVNARNPYVFQNFLITDSICLGVGIKENILGNSVSIFPNPTSSNFKVKLSLQPSEQTTLIISNLLGERVAEYLLTEKITEINPTFNNGIYLLNIISPAFNLRQKLILER